MFIKTIKAFINIAKIAKLNQVWMVYDFVIVSCILSTSLAHSFVTTFKKYFRQQLSIVKLKKQLCEKTVKNCYLATVNKAVQSVLVLD